MRRLSKPWTIVAAVGTGVLTAAGVVGLMRLASYLAVGAAPGEPTDNSWVLRTILFASFAVWITLDAVIRQKKKAAAAAMANQPLPNA